MHLIENKVKRSLKTAEELYHRLLLIVGKCGTGKTSIIQNLAKLDDTDPININLYLSKELLELTEKQRQLKLSEILTNVMKDRDEIVFLDNIEILFDVELKQDPLRLLQGLSRNRTIIATWNGSFENGKLIYAEAGHCEYKSYDIKSTLIFSINGEAQQIKSSKDK